MRAFTGVAVLGAMLMTAPAFAQAPAQPAPKPATLPASPAAPPAPALPVAKFPEGTKFAFINIQRIANESAEGKVATTKVQALNQKKVTELNERNKALQADQQKLQSGGGVMSDSARAELEKKIERQQVDIQRATQDAQQEVQELQQQLQSEFQTKLMPIVQQVFNEKGLQILFSAGDSGIVWADPGLDITEDVIKRFDVGRPAPKAPAAAAPQAAPPAAPPAAPKPAPKPPQN
jgi:outer membrane protein